MEIAGINPAGHESGNAQICEGRDLPWLQESGGSSVWIDWSVAYRDVVILDAENERVAVFNLTQYDLQVQENYDALKSLLREEASAR